VLDLNRKNLNDFDILKIIEMKATTINQSIIELVILSNLSFKSFIFILSLSTKHDINNSAALVN